MNNKTIKKKKEDCLGYFKKKKRKSEIKMILIPGKLEPRT
jgi:hypothetical protein